jgi:cob(I)alamin adenosyltransferase
MIQIYTGAGKGKTTAAIGLTIRALGADKRIFFMQFMKGLAYSEQNILKNLSKNLVLKTTGKPFFIAEEGMLSEKQKKDWGDEVVIFPAGKPPADYIALMEAGFQEVVEAALAKKYDMLILDEINVALFFKLLSRKAVEQFLLVCPPEIEIVMTGRNAPAWLIARADLVTEMQEIKHYYTKGIQARLGIEN